jgi:hypothetical protein
MRPRTTVLIGAAIAWIAAAAPPAAVPAQAQTSVEPRRAGMQQISHIVIIVKGYHSFDNYFGTFPGADGATTGIVSTGASVALGHTPDVARVIDNSYMAAVEAIDGGKMDRFDSPLILTELSCPAYMAQPRTSRAAS